MDLAGVYGKLDRAENHLDGLQEQVAVFLKDDAHDFRHHYDLKASRYSLSIEVRRELPVMWSVIVGDLVHNLRSGLDHLMWQLVLAGGGKPNGATAFPVLRHAPATTDEWKSWRKKIRGVHPVVTEVIRSIQPYETQDGPLDGHALIAVKALSNQDKHELPVARVQAIGALSNEEAASVGLEAVEDIELGAAQIAVGVPLEDGDEIAWARATFTGPNPKVEIKGKFPVQLAFGDRGILLQGLVDMCDRVRKTVELLDSAGSFYAKQ
jgi:hypothetical protein